MSRIAGNSALSVSIVGAPQVHAMFRKFLEPELTATVFAGNKAAAKLYAKELRSAAKPLSGRMAKAVRVRTAKSGKPDVIVGTRRKVAFFWPFVVGGTKQHGARGTNGAQYLTWKRKDGGYTTRKNVRGVGAHPIVEAVTERAAAAAGEAFASAMPK